MNRMDDDLDDLALPQRPRRPDPRSFRDDVAEMEVPPEREFTLSTGTVLAIFFGLALICAVFFGFGYSMGKKSGTAAVLATATSAADNADTGTADNSANKPSAGSPAAQPVPAYQGPAAADTSVQPYKPSAAASAKNGAATVTVPLDGGAPSKVKPAPADDPDGKIVESPVKPAAAAALPSTPMPSVSATGTVYVQVAAVSHKEDADVLVSALKRRGYTVFTRGGSDADKLIHVQLGPFATKKDADAMRQRLLGDGYNAIVK